LGAAPGNFEQRLKSLEPEVGDIVPAPPNLGETQAQA
jgi:hypothetical protein